MGNLITDRVAYFLKDVPPFSFLSDDELDLVAQQITVIYLEPDEVLFEEGQEQNGFCYILNKGNMKLLKAEGEKKILVDQCEPGEVFGVRSIITGNDYSMSAICVKESLVYAVPKTHFESLFKSNTNFSNYFASGYAAGQVIVRSDQDATKMSGYQPSGESFDYSKEVVTCTKDHSIQDAASIMRDSGVGSIIISNERSLPIGIVTDTDLRNKVLAEGADASKSIASIMNSPVKTVAPKSTLTEVLMEMIRSGVHHLVVTKDGTSESEICGVVSDHDVVLAQLNHPASLLKAIKRTDNVEEWKRIREKAEVLLQDYLNQGITGSLITHFITKINDILIEKAIAKALLDYPEVGEISFCWLNLGSEGREEQLLRTDQDNAILFEDQTDNNQSQSLLLNLGNRVNEILIACGFEECPANIMARNPMYCQPLSEWKRYFHGWITTPEPQSVMKATIFFDYRIGYGNAELIRKLDTFLLETIDANDMFLKFLAQNALQNPSPLSFFKNFLVERGGEHKDEFDIKKRGMMPLADAARLLTLDHRIRGIQNTIERFKRLAEIEKNNVEMYHAAAEAYEIFMVQRAKNGLRNSNSGRYIDLKSLNKLEKQILKNAFSSIKEIQDLIKVRFQQAYFQ